jgi:hypothetical protein
MVRFLWNATRGYRLRPWASPITPDIFFHFVWSERKSLWSYLKWVGEMAKQKGRTSR